MKIFPAFFLMTLMVFFSCANDAPSKEETQNSLMGKWDIVEGYRNGRLTETLTGTFFEFKPDNTIVYNLGGAREETTYQMDGLDFTPDSERLKATYHIEEISDSTLILTMEMRNMPFRLVLIKSQ